jgi:hypothetical protein
MKGSLIHVGEYPNPAVIDEEKPEIYKLEYTKFDDNGVVSRGVSHIDPRIKHKNTVHHSYSRCIVASWCRENCW